MADLPPEPPPPEAAAVPAVKKGGDAASAEERARPGDLELVDTPASRFGLGMLGLWIAGDGVTSVAAAPLMGLLDLGLGGMLLYRAGIGRPLKGRARLAFPALLCAYFGAALVQDLVIGSMAGAAFSGFFLLWCATLVAQRLKATDDGDPERAVVDALDATGQLDRAYEDGGMKDQAGTRAFRLGCGGVCLVLGVPTTLVAGLYGLYPNLLGGLAMSTVGAVYIYQGLSGRSYALRAREDAPALEEGEEEDEP